MAYESHEDWIHKMTTEELVTFLSQLADCEQCFNSYKCTAEPTDGECRRRWRQWLAE